MNDETIQSTARVVVIGGGIAGCSTLYHLTREGWTDVVLVERDELTSGSTWHAAAQVTQFGTNQTTIALKRHSIDLYRELAADPEHPIGYHISGGMRLAHTAEQVDTYKHFIGMAAGVGVDMEFIDAAEVGRRHPLINTDGLLGAWWDPLDGDIDPAGITFALARKAREAGARVYRFNPVEAISRTASGEFVVHTKKGDITCEKVVNASGYRVNEVGAMLGVSHPVISMEHMYFLTESLPELEALDFRVPIIRDPGDDFYSRQEKNGLLVGVYEQGCKTFGMDGIDPNFTQALCPPDLDRCLDNMERIFERMPALTRTGIRSVINGPITYTIDGAPLIGQVPGVENAYCAIGLRAGIGESGGHGKILAEIIVHGESEWEAWHLDPRRFTDYATRELTCLKSIEDYQNEFHYHLPHEHRPAGRLARTTPLYSTLDAEGAAWGVVNGWERALFFKPSADFVDVPGFRFTDTDAVVAAEIDHLQHHVSVMEVSGFNRYELKGEGLTEALDHLTCSRLPRVVGRVGLCYFLSELGHLVSEATLIKQADDHFWWGSAAAAEWHDRDWLQQHLPPSIELREQTTSHGMLVIAGPKSRALLQALAPRDDCSLEAFPPLRARTIQIGQVEVLAMSVSFSGELAWELHVPNAQLLLLWRHIDALRETFTIGRFGLNAAESMRLEKGYLHWKTEISYERTPFEAGLDRFTRMEKEFVGKAALADHQHQGLRSKLATLAIDCDHAPAHAGDGVFAAGKQVGTVTSGGKGHRVAANLAFAYIDPAQATVGTDLSVGILGETYPAKVVESPLYDPQMQRVRA
ncbi:FAD-dependent oxidoreductase [Gammaproteobacteria bacterium]|nr:FAD-dependent oxidoreductase [Gammaproteobacteria bacterium]